MKKLHSVGPMWLPPIPRGYASTISVGVKSYEVTAQVRGRTSVHCHRVRIPYGATEQRAQALFGKAAAGCKSCAFERTPAEERNKPTTEPFLTEWLALHKQHLKALRDGKKDPLRLCDAVKLADAKYEVYRREITAAAELTLRRVRRGVVRVAAKGKNK